MRASIAHVGDHRAEMHTRAETCANHLRPPARVFLLRRAEPGGLALCLSPASAGSPVAARWSDRVSMSVSVISPSDSRIARASSSSSAASAAKPASAASDSHTAVCSCQSVGGVEGRGLLERRSSQRSRCERRRESLGEAELLSPLSNCFRRHSAQSASRILRRASRFGP